MAAMRVPLAAPIQAPDLKKTTRRYPERVLDALLRRRYGHSREKPHALCDAAAGENANGQFLQKKNTPPLVTWRKRSRATKFNS